MKTFGFIEDLPPGADTLPGIWENKRGPGYRVPYNLYSSLGWNPPQNQVEGKTLSSRIGHSSLLQPGLETYLTGYQKRLLTRSLALPGSHLWAPAGSGKTLAGLVQLCLSAPEKPKLVITTAAARGTWEEQCRLYTKLEPVLLTGQTPGHLKPELNSLYIVGWETLKYWEPRLVSTLWGALVMDEGHYIRRPKHCQSIVQPDGSLEFRSLGNTLSAAMKVVGRATRRSSYTATPIPGRVKDLWVQLQLVEPWQWGGFHVFGMRYCGGTHNGYGYQYNGLTNKHELRERLRYVRERVAREELASSLPPKRREVRRLALSEQNQALPMKREIKQAAKESQATGSPGAFFETMLCAAATLKHNYVIARAMTALSSGQKGVVFTGRRRDCEVLAEKFRKKLARSLPQAELWWGHGGLDPALRDGIRHEYMAHKGPALLVGTGDAWGQSINLQDTDLAIFTMLPWTPDKIIQWEGRFARLGQKRPVLICYVVARETADDHVAELLLDKLPHIGDVGEEASAAELSDALGGVDESDAGRAALLGKLQALL